MNIHVHQSINPLHIRVEHGKVQHLRCNWMPPNLPTHHVSKQPWDKGLGASIQILCQGVPALAKASLPVWLDHQNIKSNLCERYVAACDPFFQLVHQHVRSVQPRHWILTPSWQNCKPIQQSWSILLSNWVIDWLSNVRVLRIQRFAKQTV